MGGFHILDLIVILGIALLILGPKLVESAAKNVGKGVGQAKVAKDKVVSELPVEEITKFTSKIPTHPHQVVQMLLAPEKSKETEKEPAKKDE